MKIRYLILGVFLMCSLAAGTPLAAEQTYDIKEMTASVKNALDARRDRFDQIRAFKDARVIGENAQGYVELLKENGKARLLVEAENKNRRFIYQTIVEQNGLAADALKTVEVVFARVQRENAKPGDMVQYPDGVWRNK